MTSFYDANVRHSIYLERYKARLVRDILSKIKELTGDLFIMVSESDLEHMTRRDLNRLLNEVSAIVDDGYAPIVVQIEGALKEFSVYEAGWQSETLLRAGIIADLAVPSDADLWAAMYSRPFQGRLLREWLRDLAANTARRVRQAISQGYVDGRSALDIAREIRGTRGASGIMDISARGSEAMVRTAVAHTASTARARTYQANRRIRGEQWVSVLDHRTTAICRGRDGNIYPKGEGPRPPAHVGCRSTMIPVTIGNKAALATRTTYNDWLKRQPESVQDDILGQKKAKLFREGGYSVDRFIDKSGHEYTLDELRAKDRETWSEVFGE